MWHNCHGFSYIGYNDSLRRDAEILLFLIEKTTDSAAASISQLVLISDSKFMADDGGGGAGENHIFIMNAIDYLLGDRELIALRSREITNRPLLELQDNTKSKWKWINILLPSILVIAFGIFRMRREANKSKILEEIYD